MSHEGSKKEQLHSSCIHYIAATVKLMQVTRSFYIRRVSDTRALEQQCVIITCIVYAVDGVMRVVRCAWFTDIYWYKFDTSLKNVLPKLMQCTTYIHIYIYIYIYLFIYLFIIIYFFAWLFELHFAQNIQNDPSVGFFSGSILGTVYEHLLWCLQGHFKYQLLFKGKNALQLKNYTPSGNNV